MASRMIGRATCPECGFSAAHVKESEKCLYRYCPECNAQYYAKTERQRSNLMDKTRAIDGNPTATTTTAAAPATGGSASTSASPTATDDTAGATGSPTAPPPPAAATVRRNRLFG